MNVDERRNRASLSVRSSTKMTDAGPEWAVKAVQNALRTKTPEWEKAVEELRAEFNAPSARQSL